MTITKRIMDTATSSEGDMEKSKTTLSSTVLRPNAPAFTPSSAVVDVAAVTTTTVGSISNGDAGRCNHENSRMRNHRCDRQSRNQKKKKIIRTKKSQRQRQRQRESINETYELDPNVPNTRNNKHELDNTTTTTTKINNKNDNRSKKGDRPRRSKTKYNGKSRQRNQHPMENSKSNRKNTDGKDNTALPRKESSIECQKQGDNSRGNNNNNSISKDEFELASSLAFPALMEASSLSSSSARHKMQQTTWNSLTDIKDLLREEKLRDDCTSKEQQEVSDDEETKNWQNGLDRLTSHDGKTKLIRTGHRQPEFSSWDEDEEAEEKEDAEKTFHETKQSVAIDEKTVSSTLDIILAKSDPELFSGLGKRTFDINRLRDRWWVAVADQQRRIQYQQAAKELEEQQEKPSYCVETNHETIYDGVDENIQTNRSGSNYEDCSISNTSTISNTSSSSQNDDIHLSALHQNVKNDLPLYQATMSKKQLLDLIIERHDDRALRDMVELSWNTENENEPVLNHVVMGHKNGHIGADRILPFGILEEDRIEEDNGVDLVEHAIDVVIHRNQPSLLRTILSVTRGRAPINSKPLIQATRLGHEECASILLSKQEKGSTMLFLNDVDGNTALHYCCRENGNKDMLLTLLKQVVGNTKGKRQQLSKLVTARNKYLQTSLHIACQSGRNDLVEVFLTTCKSSLLFKILSIEDIKHETPLLCAVSNNSCDVVLSLLMWRRNHDHQRQKQAHTQKQVSQVNKAQNTTCPLVWAAKSGNLEMIDLLIQFGDQSGILYQVTEALLTLLLSDIPADIKLKGSDSLILAGGNPFQEIAYPGLIDGEKETSINVATKTVSVEIVRSIISTASRLVNERQLVRRRDPILQQQPEAFFRTLESKENSEANRAIRNALMETLCRAYSNQRLLDISKAIVLYEQIKKVEEEYIIQLQASLRTGTVSSVVHQPKNWCFLATYRHATSAVIYEGSKPSWLDCDRSVFAENSLRLLKILWVQNEVRKAECFCPWVSRNAKKSDTPPDLLAKDMLTLIANDGSRFLVHAPTVSNKSGKLASALRFAQMKCDEDSFGEVINLEVAIAPGFCKLMIQHMYHGSISFGWPNLNDNEMCRYLLELMLIAEEFLVPSLVQEIEMRLLSSKPLRCFCWDCCQALRVTSSNDGQKEAQCLFSINNNSRLVNRETVMDVLSLTDYMGGLDYDIFLAPIILDFCVEPKKLWANYDREVRQQKFWKVNKALSSLRNIAIITILKEFAYVVESPDCYLTSENDRNGESQKQILLRICLDELRNNSAIAMAYSSPIEKQTSANRKD